jgi:nickel-dependent lactate racemase
MSPIRLSRRAFLKGAGAAAGIPLIGTALAAEQSKPVQVAALKGAAKSVVIPTHEFYGNLDERLDFPVDWDVHVMNMKGHNTPALTVSQIAKDLGSPVGTPPLRELAAGKETVVITFDDLNRATPAYAVVPWVLSELKTAGIRDENILFMGSSGTHRAMTALEVQKKIGTAAATRYAWVNHNCFFAAKDVGTTSFKNRIRINQTFMAADLKITLSGIKVHYMAGYSGGAKAVMPGVAHVDSIAYNHGTLLRQIKTSGALKVFNNEMRQDLNEAARLAGVDFSVQIIYNQKLQPIQVFSGDIVDAYHAAVRPASQLYCTPTFPDADVVVSNAYPHTCQASHAQRWIDYSLKKEGGTGVLILQHPLTLDPVHHLKNIGLSSGGASYFDLVRRQKNAKLPNNSALIVYSQYMDRTLANNYPRGTYFVTKWEDVIEILQKRHGGSSVRAAVYPYGGLQHQELALDG